MKSSWIIIISVVLSLASGNGMGCLNKPAASAATLIGVCAELCGDACPEGFVCRSNGCGHTCQPLIGKHPCPQRRCALFCPFGFQVINGCTSCTCNPDPLVR